ncbi:MAG: hypothetical protein AABZ53_17400 [Planctomycetota bacterium]
MITRFLGILCVAACVASVGCDDKKPQPPLSSPRPAAGPAAAPPKGAAVAPTDQSDSTVSATGVAMTLPPAWKRNPPANQMRLAEAQVPDASGDPAKVCLVVFSTAGGTVEENVARWAGQVRDAKGQPVPGKTESQTVNGLKISVVEMTGTFAGMGDTLPKENWTIRGAIVEAPEGLLFIKMTGPAESVAAAAKDFQAMLLTAKKL